MQQAAKETQFAELYRPFPTITMLQASVALAGRQARFMAFFKLQQLRLG
ncbi:hypothetical protein [Pseudomonas anguilliseptica]|nr:hypothetical protein [Pseudomonas anguilliseptica]